MAAAPTAVPDIKPLLDQLAGDKELKASAWDAFHGSNTPDDFRSKFDKLNIPKEVKANLWDLKFGGGRIESIRPEEAPSPDLSRPVAVPTPPEKPPTPPGRTVVPLAEAGPPIARGEIPSLAGPVSRGAIATLGRELPPAARPAAPLPPALAGGPPTPYQMATAVAPAAPAKPAPVVPMVGGPPAAGPARIAPKRVAPGVERPAAVDLGAGPPVAENLKPSRMAVRPPGAALLPPVTTLPAGVTAPELAPGLAGPSEEQVAAMAPGAGVERFANEGLGMFMPDITQEMSQLPPDVREAVYKAIGYDNIASVGLTKAALGMLTSPKNLALMVAFPGAAAGVQALVNMPRIAQMLKGFPQALKFVDALSQAAVPGAITGASAPDVANETIEAARAAQEGRTGEFIAHAAKAVGGAAVMGVAGRAGLKGGAKGMEAYPEGGPPLEGGRAVKAKVGELEAGGRNLAAEYLKGLTKPAEGTPEVQLQIGGKDITLSRIADTDIPAELKGKGPFFRVTGPGVPKAIEGSQQQIMEFLQARGAAGFKTVLPPEAPTSPEAAAMPGGPPVAGPRVMAVGEPAKPAAGAPPAQPEAPWETQAKRAEAQASVLEQKAVASPEKLAKQKAKIEQLLAAAPGNDERRRAEALRDRLAKVVEGLPAAAPPAGPPEAPQVAPTAEAPALPAGPPTPPEEPAKPPLTVAPQPAPRAQGPPGTQDITTGWTDLPLDERGRASGEAVAQQLADQGGVDEIHTSHLRRASETARQIAAKNEVREVIPDEALAPIKLGQQEGRTSAETKPVIERMIREPDWIPPGGESMNAFLARTGPALNALKERAIRYPDRNFVVVTHSRNIEAAQHVVNGVPLKDAMLADKVPPGGMLPILPNLKLVRHGATEWDKGAGPPAAATSGATQARPEGGPPTTPAAPRIESIRPEGGPPAPQSPYRRLMDAVRFSLSLGEKINNPMFDRMAAQAFGGTRAEGRYDPRDAYDALETAVNRQVIDNGGKLWQQPPHEAISEIREVESRLPTQTTRTQEQIERQQFSTPPSLAFVAAKALNPQPGETVLEPSAGTGSLAVWAKVAGANVETNEIAPRRRELLEELGFQPYKADAEFLNSTLPQDVRPTAILMNPPFSTTGGRVAAHKTAFGLRHVSEAMSRLAPGGRLVAILGEGQGIGRPAVADWWRDILSRYNVRADVGISGENYRKYGTNFGNRLVVIDKVPPQKPQTGIARGNFETLEEVYDALAPIAADRPAIQAGAEQPRPGAQAQQPARSVAPGPRGGGPGTPGPARPGSAPGPNLRPGGGGIRGGEPVSAPGAGEGPAVSAPGVRALQPGVGPGEAGGRKETQPAGELPVRGGGVAPAGELPALKPQPTAPLNPAEQEIEEETGDTSFVPYRSALAGKHPTHPGNIVETAPMASASAPPIKYEPNLSDDVRKNISDLQLEAVSLAGQRFEQRLPGGERAGFFIGDGTGIGKGREIGAIIEDYWNRGGRKILWASAGPRLIADAQRDLKDLGLDKKIPMKMINDYPAAGEIKLPEGAIFSAYASLASMSKKAGRRRVDQLKPWLGDGPLLIFDESHMAKNVIGENGVMDSKGSEQAKAVVELQRAIPNARVLYVSATGATEVGNLAYLTRVGFWGRGTSFPGGFNQFHNEIAAAGVGAMETIARDMKSAGAYVSRHLSFGPPHPGARPVEHIETDHHITPEQERIYNAAADVWQEILKNIEQAIRLTNAGPRQKARGMSQFWAAEQRFFKQLITSFKVPTIIKQTDEALSDKDKDGKAKEPEAVVISLISTNEARAEDQVTKAAESGVDLDDLEFSPIETVGQFIDNVFPVEQYVEVTDEEGNTKSVVLTDKAGNPVVNREAELKKQELLDKLREVHMPRGVLDQLVNHFGPDKVAEMTGRSHRLLQDPDTGKLEYKARNPHGVSMKDVNIWENKQFQSGEKKIAIISGAAGTGISLHASRREKNQLRRRHIVAELGWSADRQIQSFGRTHRSDEESAPIYDLVSSNIAGEKRFSSTIARRLESLGALSRGERKSTGAGQLAKYNFESDYGRAAIRALYQGVLRGDAIPGISEARQALRDMAVLRTDKDGRETIAQGDMTDVPRFLNRILALRLNDQNAFFDHFAALFDHAVTAAKQNGTFDEGVTDVKAQSIKLLSQNLIRTDSTSGAETRHYELELERPNLPTPWKEVERMYADVRGQFYVNRRSGQPAFARTLPPKTDEATGQMTKYFALYRPQASGTERVIAEDLAARFDPAQPSAVKATWEEKYAAAPKIRKNELHVIGGMITPLWQRLRTSQQIGLKVVRLRTTNTGQRIVGAEIPTSQIGTVLQNLGLADQATNPEQVWREVYDRGGTVPLVEGSELKRSKLAGEPVIEFVSNDHYKFNELRGMGLINETIQHRQRFFVPTEESLGKPILGAILNRWPALKQKAREIVGGTAGELRPQALARGARRLGERFRNRPRSHYSFAAAAKSKFVRGLQETKALSREAYEAGLKFGGSKGQARIHQVGALQAIEKALKAEGSDPRFKGPEAMKHFWAMRAESRLRGIRLRWYDMADDARDATFSDFKEAYEGDYSALLDKIEGRAGPDEGPRQHADALFAAGKLGELANYVADLFETAGDRVATVEEVADDFDELRKDPGYQAGLQIYRDSIEKPIAETHAANEGVFSDALGPDNVYSPLVALTKEGELAHGRPPGKGTAFRKPANIGNYFATGLAAGYDISGAPIFDRLEAMRRINNKAAFLAELHDLGVLRPLGRREDPGRNPVIRFRGVDYKAVPVETSKERVIIKNGKANSVPATRALIPTFIYNEAKPLLDKDPRNWDSGLASGFLSHLTYLTLIGPTDFVWHMRNYRGVMAANTPFIGSSWLQRNVLGLPVINWFGVIGSLLNHVLTVDPLDPVNLPLLQEMAEAGTIPTRWATETFSKELAEKYGVRRSFNLGTMLYAPRGLDIHARMLMYEAAKKMNQDMRPGELGEFVNQLGNYVFDLESHVERTAKASRLSPFATAGTTMLRNGINAWLGTSKLPILSGPPEPPEVGPPGTEPPPPLPPMSKADQAKWRIALRLKNGAWSLVALWAVSHYALRGKWPWEDKLARLFELPVPESFKKTRLGVIVFGKAKGTTYVRIDWLNPMATRGAAGMGIRAYWNIKRLGGTDGQASEAASKDILNAFAHPFVSGPAIRMAMVGLAGQEPYISAFRDRITARPTMQFRSAIGDVPPGGPRWAKQAREAVLTINPFAQTSAAAAGFGQKAVEEKDLGNRYLRAVINTAVPGLLNSYNINPERQAKSLRIEAKKIERAERKSSHGGGAVEKSIFSGPPGVRVDTTGPLTGGPPI